MYSLRWKVIDKKFENANSFSQLASNVNTVLDGFKAYLGLSYCIIAKDETHIPWLLCPEQPYFQYWWYKRYAYVAFFLCVFQIDFALFISSVAQEILVTANCMTAAY